MNYLYGFKSQIYIRLLPIYKLHYKSKLDITRYYSSMKYIEGRYTIEQIHPLLSTNTSCTRDINRIPVPVKIATGTYITCSLTEQNYSGYVSPLCKLCSENNEELSHFVLYWNKSITWTLRENNYYLK